KWEAAFCMRDATWSDAYSAQQPALAASRRAHRLRQSAGSLGQKRERFARPGDARIDQLAAKYAAAVFGQKEHGVLEFRALAFVHRHGKCRFGMHESINGNRTQLFAVGKEDSQAGISLR